MNSYRYRAPNGLLIVGSLETMTGRAGIIEFNARGYAVYDGETEVYWNDQRTVTRRGARVYLDDQGGEWTLSQCTREAMP